MNSCSDLEKYLAGNLVGMGLMDFERHLGTCDSCRLEVEKWKKIAERVEDWSSSFELPKPTAAEAAELVVGLKPKTNQPVWRRPVFAMGAASTVFAALVLFVLFGGHVFDGASPNGISKSSQSDTDSQYPVRVVYSERSEIPSAEDRFAKRFVVPGDGSLIFELGQDRIGLSAKSEMLILQSDDEQTRLRLERGEVAVDVESRTNGGSFSIEVGDCTVKVVGTRFKVSKAPESRLSVFVDEGEVLVSGPGEMTHRVKSGQVLELATGNTWHYLPLVDSQKQHIAAMLTPPGQKPEGQVLAATQDASDNKRVRPTNRDHKNDVGVDSADGISTWRAWILDGQYQKAETALLTHLKKQPNDFRAMSPLASCRRKVGNWPGAVETYKRIIKGDAKFARSARFDAAVLLQDRLGNHAQAAGLLSDYLEADPLLEAEAMLRLAKAWLKMGRSSDAQQLLVAVRDNHGSTSSAIRAAKLLDKMSATD